MNLSADPNSVQLDNAKFLKLELQCQKVQPGINVELNVVSG